MRQVRFLQIGRRTSKRPSRSPECRSAQQMLACRVTHWQSCRKTSFSCELDPSRDSEAHSSSKVAATASRKSTARTRSRLANAGAAASLLIALLKYSCINGIPGSRHVDWYICRAIVQCSAPAKLQSLYAVVPEVVAQKSSVRALTLPKLSTDRSHGALQTLASRFSGLTAQATSQPR